MIQLKTGRTALFRYSGLERQDTAQPRVPGGPHMQSSLLAALPSSLGQVPALVLTAHWKGHQHDQICLSKKPG